MSDEATAASCEFPWVLPSEYCSHVEEAQSCSSNLPLPIQPKWLLTQLRLHNTSKRLFIAQKHSLCKLSVQLLVPLSVCHKSKTKKKFLFFLGQAKRISEVSFVLLFGLKFVVFSCCFPKSPQFIFPYIVIAFPISANLCKWKCWLIRC